jgi:hypothetical protein
MSKFNLKKAVAEAAIDDTCISSGYYAVQISEVAEVGFQPAFNSSDPAKESVGFTFKLTNGQQISKVMSLTVNAFSNFVKVLNSVDDADELEDFAGKQLDLEIEANGKYPKIKGFLHSEDGLSGEDKLPALKKTTFYSVDKPNPAVLKTLHQGLRQAISSRIRAKG